MPIFRGNTSEYTWLGPNRQTYKHIGIMGFPEEEMAKGRRLCEKRSQWPWWRTKSQQVGWLFETHQIKKVQDIIPICFFQGDCMTEVSRRFWIVGDKRRDILLKMQLMPLKRHYINIFPSLIIFGDCLLINFQVLETFGSTRRKTPGESLQFLMKEKINKLTNFL